MSSQKLSGPQARRTGEQYSFPYSPNDCIVIVQVPGGNAAVNVQVAADAAVAQHPAADGLAPADPHEDGNQEDEAELDDDEDEDEKY